jgi:hypothetical protein
MLKDKGALMQLVAFGDSNLYYNYDSALNVKQLSATSNHDLLIDYDTDAIKFHTIIIPTDVNIDDITSFTIKCICNDSAVILFEIPFRLLYDLSVKKIKGDKTCITLNDSITNIFEINEYDEFRKYVQSLPKDQCHDTHNFKHKNKIQENYMMNYNFPLVALYKSKISLFITSKIDIKYDVLIQRQFLNTQKRHHVASNDHGYYINSFGHQSFNYQNFQFVGDHPTTGLFIKTKNKLTNFKLNLNDIELINYDELKIDVLTELIIDQPNNYLYWIPFEPNKKWDIDNYSSDPPCCIISLNLSKIYKVNIELNTVDNIYDGCVYSLSKNIMRIYCGIADLQYLNN